MSGEGEVNKCRSCNSSDLISIISLGNQYISNFIEPGKPSGTRVPLELILCNSCKLLQLRHNAPDGEMWGEQYWYKSGINRLIRGDLNDIVDCSEKIIAIGKGDIVVDIGCNDGTLLGFYDKDGIERVGFEPSKNVAKEAASKGYKIIDNFFNASDFRLQFDQKKAKIITAISMFYDLDNPNKFLQDITSILDENGVFVIQQNYLVSMLEQNAFDNICHEHRAYYSLTSLNTLLERHDLEVFDVKLRDINGGSIRTYIRKKDRVSISPFVGAKERLVQLLERERQMELGTAKPYMEFAKRIDDLKKQMLSFIDNEKREGKTFCLCGASTRGNTTLQYFGINTSHVIAAVEANPDKWGKVTVGSNIPIVSVEELKKLNPDYQIVLIWHLFDGLMEKETDYLLRGGKFILPLPKFKVIEHSKDFDRLMATSFL
jgi:SAM-dependent methyltransferase